MLLHLPGFLNNNSQNRDLKCNGICKLPVFSSCLGTFYGCFVNFLDDPNYVVHDKLNEFSTHALGF